MALTPLLLPNILTSSVLTPAGETRFGALQLGRAGTYSSKRGPLDIAELFTTCPVCQRAPQLVSASGLQSLTALVKTPLLPQTQVL